MMDVTRETDQATLWNGPGGRAWVDAQEAIDQVLKPFEDLLVDAVTARGFELKVFLFVLAYSVNRL